MGHSTATRSAAVPDSHADLLGRPLSVVMTTEMPDGVLQSTVVWFSVEGAHLLVNSMREFRKVRNLAERPRTTVLVMEPAGDRRWHRDPAIVTLEDEEAMAHLDGLARAYCDAERYFGDVVPEELARVEHPVLCRLHPVSITTGPSLLPEPRADGCRRRRRRPVHAAVSRRSRPPIARCSSARSSARSPRR